MTAQPTRFQEISPSAQCLLAEGEAVLVEFKRGVEAVTPKLLAALTNSVALAADADVAQLLIGVDEIADPRTGWCQDARSA
jgi:hypothetical protein